LAYASGIPSGARLASTFSLPLWPAVCLNALLLRVRMGAEIRELGGGEGGAIR